MIKKQKLLFVIDSLGAGGAERSLLNLLSVINYSKYDVDLQLFNLKGELASQIPIDVNVLQLPEAIGILNKPVAQLLKKPGVLIRKAVYSFSIKYLKLYNAGKASLYWKLFGKYFDRNNYRYDMVVGYSQGIPTFYTTDKVDAQKKIVWVNVDYNISGWVKRHQKKYYEDVDVIVNVSQPVYEMFSSEMFPEFKDKMVVIRDLISPEYIRRMSDTPVSIPLKKDLAVIMTVGRLNKPQKGYDLAIEAAKILHKKGVKFRWYAVGEGPYRSELEKFIEVNGLHDRFVLLGSTSNPYALMAESNVYVQPSRHEGFGITLAEAMILGIPAVATCFNTVGLHVKDGETGFITSFNPEEIADKIELLLTDKLLYSRIKENLKCEKFGNIDEVNKFYSLIY